MATRRLQPASNRALPDPAGAIGQTLAQMRAVDAGFDPAAFLDGAEKAFRMIVSAFAAGDRGPFEVSLRMTPIAPSSRRLPDGKPPARRR